MTEVMASPTIAVAGAIALVLLPGGALAHVVGFRGLWWLAVSPALSVAAMTTIGVVLAPAHIPFAWWQPAAAIVVACAVILGVRAARRRRLLRPRIGRWSRGELLVIVVIAVAAVVSGAITAIGIGSWDHISQTYDGLFHLNASASILTTGDASSFDLYRLTHPGKTDNEFYPAAWHTLVASTAELTGSGIPVAMNAVYVAVQSAIWLPGIALFGAVISPARRRHLGAALTTIASIGLIGFPTLLLSWGTLYPTVMAYVLLPVGLALAVQLMRWVAMLPSQRRIPPRWQLLIVLALWILASAFSHPRSLFGWVVIVAPLVIIDGLRVVGRIWGQPARRRRLVIALSAIALALIAVIGAGLGFLYEHYLVYKPISKLLNGGPATASQDLFTSIVQALDLSPQSPNGLAIPPSFVLAALVVVGVVIAFTRPRLRWVAVAWILIVVLYAAAAGSNSDLAKLMTGVWYKDKFRLYALLPVVQAPLIAIVGVRLSLLATRGARVVATSIAALSIGVGAATSSAVTFGSTMIDAEFALPVHDKGGRLIDRDEQRLLEQLPSLVPVGQEVAGDPWDGSSLSWAIGDRRSMFPHVAGAWTPDEVLVASSLDRLETDPAVCAAVQRLGIHWVVEDPELLWGNPVEATPYSGFHTAVKAGVLTTVARVGSAGLYRIPSCTA